jgi:lipoprotein NlpI
LDFTKALEINPRDAWVYNSRGVIYSDKGQHDQAVLDFTKALEINPAYSQALFNRAKVYYSKREYDKSWKDINELQESGQKVPPEFLNDLRKASGREK